MSIFSRKTLERQLEEQRTAVRIQPGQISISGMQLENEVRMRLGLSPDWELKDMQPLLTWLATRFAVALVTCRSGWACDVSRTDIVDNGQCIREFGSQSPAIALARGALAAVHEWGS